MCILNSKIYFILPNYLTIVSELYLPVARNALNPDTVLLCIVKELGKWNGSSIS